MAFAKVARRIALGARELSVEQRRRLVQVSAEWCPPFTGYHLYYPSRRQPSAAFTLPVDARRFRGAQRQAQVPAARVLGAYLGWAVAKADRVGAVSGDLGRSMVF
jgi:hypothetical protein